MNNKELRLGNLVRVDGADYKVLMLGKRNDLIKLEGLGLVGISRIEPTPITPDILESLGFKKAVIGYYFDLDQDMNTGSFLGVLVTNEMEVVIIMYGDYFTPDKKTEYYLECTSAHHLQNLCAALSNTVN